MLKPGSSSEKGVTRFSHGVSCSEFGTPESQFLERDNFPLAVSLIKLSRPNVVSLGPLGASVFSNSALEIATLKNLEPLTNLSILTHILTSTISFHPFGFP